MNLRKNAASQSQRRRLRPVTDGFGTAWREGVEQPLRNYLASCGHSAEDIDDILQETAIRAIEHAAYYGSSEHLRRWAFVVAKRLSVDLYRSRRRLVPADEAVERDLRQEDDLQRVEDRDLLRAVFAAVETLPPRERNSLGQPVAETLAERKSNGMARYRARKRLRQLVGPIAVAIAWLRRQGEHATIGGAVTAAAVIAPLVALTHGGHGNHAPAASAAQHPARVVLAATAHPAGRSAAGAVRRSTSLPARHERQLPVSAGAHHGGATSAVPPVSAHGPVDSQAAVWQDGNDGNQPLVCVDLHNPDDTHWCLDLPTGIGGHALPSGRAAEAPR